MRLENYTPAMELSFCSLMGDPMLTKSDYIKEPTMLQMLTGEDKTSPITTAQSLFDELDAVYAKEMGWEKTFRALSAILNRVNLTTSELNKYKFFDAEKCYIRNMMHTDDKHYTLILMCWNPGKESKVHDHPCDCCFIKTLSGCLKESRYVCDESTGRLKHSGTKFYNEGQVSWMTDDVGYHSVGNPCPNGPAVSLHLYTPPFGSCRVWRDTDSSMDDFCTGKIGFYSINGHRSPYAECCPSQHVKNMRSTMHELLEKKSAYQAAENDRC